MPHRALSDVMLGHAPPARAGELIPDTFVDSNGDKQPVDFDRLVELGAAEKISAREAKKAAADTSADDTADQDTDASDDAGDEDSSVDDPPQE